MESPSASLNRLALSLLLAIIGFSSIAMTSVPLFGMVHPQTELTSAIAADSAPGLATCTTSPETAVVSPQAKLSGVTISLQKISGSTYKITVTNDKQRYLSVILVDADTSEVLTPYEQTCGSYLGEIVSTRTLVGGVIPVPNSQELATAIDLASHPRVKVKVFGPAFNAFPFYNLTHDQSDAIYTVIPSVYSLVFDLILNIITAVAIDMGGGGSSICQDALFSYSTELLALFQGDMLGDCDYYETVQSQIASGDFFGYWVTINQEILKIMQARLPDIIVGISDILIRCGVEVTLRTVLEYSTVVLAAYSKLISVIELGSSMLDIATNDSYVFFLIENLPVALTLNASPQGGCAGANIVLGFDALPATATFSKVEWDFDGDGTTDHISSSTQASHAYTAAGSFTPKVTVTDSDGMVATSSTKVGITAGCIPITGTLQGYLDATTFTRTHPLSLANDGEMRLIVNVDPSLNLNCCNAYGYIDIYESDGTTKLFSWRGPSGGNDLTKTLGPVGLAAGDYLVKVGRDSGNGNYIITTNFSPQALLNDAEPNYDPLSAKPIEINAGVTGHLGYKGGGAGTEDNVDMFKIVLPSDGEMRLTLNVTPTLNLNCCDMYGYLQIYDDDGTTKLYDWRGPGGGSDLTKTFGPIGLAAGTYYLKLARNSGYGAYTLITSFLPQSISNDVEPNIDHLSAKPITTNCSITGHLGYCGGGSGFLDNVDMYKMILPSDGDIQFTVNVSPTLNLNCCNMYGYLQVYDRDGTTKLYDWRGPGGGSDLTKTFGPIGLAAGTYYLKLARDSGYGAYMLSTTYSAQPLTNDIEPNADYLSAQPISVNDRVTGHLGYCGGGFGNFDNADMFKCTLPSPGQFKVALRVDPSLNLNCCNMYGYLQIYASDGTTKLHDWRGPGGGSDLTKLFGPVDLGVGTYFIKIGRDSNYGAYELTTFFSNANPKIDDFVITPTRGLAPLDVACLFRVSDLNPTDIQTIKVDMNGDGTPDFDVTGSPYGTLRYSYLSAGVYTATITATDDHGGLARKTLSITVESHPYIVLGSVVGPPGSIVSVPINITTKGMEVCGASSDISFGDSSLEFLDALLGPSGANAGKEVQFSAIAPGSVRILIIGTNAQGFSDGTLAYARFSVKETVPQGSILHISETCTATDCSARTLTTTCAGATITASASKPGDCNLDGAISIGEVQKSINMFLGTAGIECGVDCNADGNISIGEVQKVINIFLGIAVGC